MITMFKALPCLLAAVAIGLAVFGPALPAQAITAKSQCLPPASATGTTTKIRASPDPATAGQPVTLAATVTPASGTVTPVGSVQFWIGGTAIGAPATLDADGAAVTTTTFTASGTEALSAVYTPADATVFIASTGTLSLTVNPAAAAAGSSEVPLAATDPPNGAFSLTVDGTEIVTLTPSGSTATAAATLVTVSDTLNTYPGWSVSGQAARFVGSGTADGATIAGNQLGWTPTAAALGPGVILGPAVPPSSPGLGDEPALLASAPAGHGYGTSVLGAKLTLDLPASAAAGPYAGSLTVTAVSVNP